MSNVVDRFVVGEFYTNDQIRFSLDLENLGGIRPSVDAKKNLQHLAIMTAAEEAGRLMSENPYNDRIEGDVLIYTGQGREGDQQLTGRNKRLLDQFTVPAPFYGFTNVGKQTYRFLGLLELLRCYPERQLDKRGALRNVLLFEFRIHSRPSIIPIEEAAPISAAVIQESRKNNPMVALEQEIVEPDEPELPQIRSLTPLDAEQLRVRLLKIAPYSFEHLVKTLMQANRFRDVTVTSASGDGGVDIDAYVDDSDDFFSGTHVQVQVKRWRHAVGSVEINNFRGALSTTAKGVFVTTSNYTRAAMKEAHHPTKPTVTLIDGYRLSAIVARNKLNLNEF